MDDFIKCISLDPKYPESYWNKSLLHLFKGNYKDGEKSFLLSSYPEILKTLFEQKDVNYETELLEDKSETLKDQTKAAMNTLICSLP